MGDGFSSPNNLDMPLINAPVFRDIYERKHPTLLEAEGETATRVFEAMARAQKFLSPEESLAVVEVLNGTPRLLLNQYYGFIREEIAGSSSSVEDHLVASILRGFLLPEPRERDSDNDKPQGSESTYSSWSIGIARSDTTSRPSTPQVPSSTTPPRTSAKGNSTVKSPAATKVTTTTTTGGMFESNDLWFADYQPVLAHALAATAPGGRYYKAILKQKQLVEDASAPDKAASTAPSSGDKPEREATPPAATTSLSTPVSSSTADNRADIPTLEPIPSRGVLRDCSDTGNVNYDDDDMPPLEPNGNDGVPGFRPIPYNSMPSFPKFKQDNDMPLPEPIPEPIPKPILDMIVPVFDPNGGISDFEDNNVLASLPCSPALDKPKFRFTASVPMLSSVRMSFMSLPDDVLVCIGDFLSKPPLRDRHDMLLAGRSSLNMLHYSSLCRSLYALCRREVWRWLRIDRGDLSMLSMLKEIAERSDITGWIRYITVDNLCPQHEELLVPLAHIIQGATGLEHVFWRAHAVIPSNIAAALNARHATLTGLTIWRFALCSVDSLSDLRLTEFQLSQSRPGDKHCELMLQDEIQLTDGLSQMEIEDRGARRWLRDVRVLRDLLIRSSRTLKRLHLEDGFRDEDWFEKVFGGGIDPYGHPLPHFSLPQLASISLPPAILTVPAFQHLVVNSPGILDLCLRHIPPATPQLNARGEMINIQPMAPAGMLRQLRTLHYHGTRQRGGVPEPTEARLGTLVTVEPTVVSILAGTTEEGRTRELIELELGSVTSFEFKNLMTNFTLDGLTDLELFITDWIRPSLIETITAGLPAMRGLKLHANVWKVKLSTLATNLARLQHLQSLRINHSVALQHATIPLSTASDLILSGYLPSEIRSVLQGYADDYNARWAKAFEQIPALCHSLEYMEWWASDELMWEWDVVSCAPAKPTPLEREVRKKLGLKDIENERNIGGRRKVKLVGEPRIDLGAWEDMSDVFGGFPLGPLGLLNLVGLGMQGGNVPAFAAGAGAGAGGVGGAGVEPVAGGAGP